MPAPIDRAIGELDVVLHQIQQDVQTSAINVSKGGRVGTLHVENIRTEGFESVVSVDEDGYIEEAYLEDVTAIAPRPVRGRAPRVAAELEEVRTALLGLREGRPDPGLLTRAGEIAKSWGPPLLAALPTALGVLGPYIH